MVWLSCLRRANQGFLVRISMLLLIWVIQTGKILNASDPQSTLCIVIGAPGESEYGEMFKEWRSQWLKTTEGLLPVWIGEAGANELDQGDQRQEDRDRLRRWIASVEGMDEPSTCWLVLIGHGTYDGKVAKFNLRGADVSSMELGQWLKGSKHRWMIAVCASSSGPFLASLAGPDRVVITATKSGSETNFSRFGGYFAQSLGDITSDLDHDESISVLEAYVAASRKTERYYQEKKLLATEHPIFDDNGDGKGTSMDFFRGLRPIKRPEKGIADGELARRIWLVEPKGTKLLTQADKDKITEIENQIDALRDKKAAMTQEAYYGDLEKLLVELARILYPSSR
jgi:hypothetical protein